MNLLILFPNQIFEFSKIDSVLKSQKINDIVLLEHPIFFGLDSERKINFNKMKLVLHRASLLFYFDYLKEQIKGMKVGYIKVGESEKIKEIVNKYESIYYIDIPDYLVDKRMKELKAKRIDSIHPSFIYSREDLEEYMAKKTVKGYLHKNFYEWGRKCFNILMDERNKPLGGKYSYDKYNRSGPPSDIEEIPELPLLEPLDKKYIEIAKKEIEKEFSKNYGNTHLYIPVTFIGANKWFDDFLMNRLENFGKYEDAVVAKEPFLYHSVISPLLNNGLLTPQNIIYKTLDFYEKNVEKYDEELLFSVEGFIRQILGWREWQRFMYIYEYDALKNGNFYKHDRALTAAWYSGKLGIAPIDDTIKSAYMKAYLHHILRLMYMSNFMNLCRIHPHEMYNWFMSFSMDSYDWVMIQNVYGMGIGVSMTKPYITTGNYIVKMSNYSKKGEWFSLWNDLYYTFLDKNIEKLQMFPRVSWMMIRNLESKLAKEGEIERIHSVTDEFINRVTVHYK